MPSALSALLRTPSCLAALALLGSMTLAGCPAFVSDDYSSDGTDPDSGGAGGTSSDPTGGASGTAPVPPDPGKPACENGKKDPGETDVDCGRDCPNRCANDRSCASNDDCQDGNCWGGKCREPQETMCTNGKKDPLEADVDCGSLCPTKCAKDRKCVLNNDCQSGKCDKNKCKD